MATPTTIADRLRFNFIRPLVLRFNVLDLTLRLRSAIGQRQYALAECAAIDFDWSTQHGALDTPECVQDAIYWGRVADDLTQRLRIARLVLKNHQLQRGLS